MTLSSKQIVVVLIIVGFCVSYTLASSASEPAFKSQLRSCFEGNRNTECIVNQGSWNSCGRSVYSSYQLAVSISMNCMRSVCGSQNGLCCNTYCSMFGLSGSDHSNCFSSCYNSYRPSTNGGSSFGGNIPAASDALTGSVSCSIPCAAAFSFYENKVAESVAKKPAEVKTFKTLVKNLQSGKPIKKSNPGYTITSAKTLSTSSPSSATYFTALKPKVVLKGSEHNQVLRTSIEEAVPTNLDSAQFYNSQVASNQICSNSMKDVVKVSILKNTKIECSKLLQWIKNDKTIAPENLENVYNFMLVLHQKCSALPNSKCVMPNVGSIKLTNTK
ncbi:nucleoporin [Naegleria gruberi]|uniref:Nucleoporin n=1 Tax=Naegleria gruberi TaxID=5762 RepID=D2VDT7_NAEGR|nr:nucleoporin [Naegleria gruberi]EFC44957.1 nucleoporin [Naegleria gruberi]|eukprot:XP_002677701.1 nucleoporin [Naegleria gruberi]